MKKLALAPILLGSYPVLFLYAQNQEQLSLLDLWTPLLIALTASIAVFGLWWLILRDRYKAGAVTGLWAVCFWATPYLNRFTRWLDAGFCGPRHHLTLYMIFFTLLVLLLAVLIGRLRAAPLPAIQALGVMTVLLVGFSLLQIVPRETRRLFQVAQRAKITGQYTPAAAAAAGISPNIIHVVLDAYGRADVLHTRYGIDNEPFLSALEQRNFYVMRESRANYNLTLLSLASILNMDYMTGITAATPKDTGPLEEIVRDSRVRQELQQRGYRFVVFESGWPYTDLKDADEFHATTIAWTPYQARLLSMTPAPHFTGMLGLDVMDFYEMQRHRVRNVFEGVPRVRDHDKPVYVFAHVLSPHPPFVFDANGAPTQAERDYSARDGNNYYEDGGSSDEYRQGYRAQLQYINTLVLSMVDRLQKQMTRPTIMLVHGDHGPGMGLVWGDMHASDVRERMCNFAAVYLPDGEYGDWYPTLTGVNYYRTIFNHVFATDYPRLQDRSFFTDWDHLYTHATVQQQRLGLNFAE